MPGPWITNDNLKQLVANALKKDVADLEAYWDDFVSRANAAAVADINSILRGKGYSAAQIDSWDNRVTYNEDIALYHALVKGASLSDYDQQAVDRLDRRKMLDEAGAILINGEAVAPADTGTGTGGAAGGLIDDTDYRVNRIPGLWRN